MFNHRHPGTQVHVDKGLGPHLMGTFSEDPVDPLDPAASAGEFQKQAPVLGPGVVDLGRPVG